jgi:adenylylsulfate kinase-like enzyme
MQLVDFRCPTCGAEPNKQKVSAAGVTCGECPTRRPFTRGDIVNVTGCPGTGKSTVGRLLIRRLPSEFVLVETDLLNQPTDNVDEHTWMSFIERLLRLAVCLAHGGRTLVLVGYSTPWQWDDQPLRQFLGKVHHLALVCTDEELDRRLRRRESIDQAEREGLLGLNHRFREMHDVHRIDTTATNPNDVADRIITLITDPVRPM